MGLLESDKCEDNPFSVFRSKEKNSIIDWNLLIRIGARDTIRFIQEPHGHLPYNRAKEIEKYIQVLFSMVVHDGENQVELRSKIQSMLSQAPYSETMHQLYYKIISQETK